MDRLLAFYEYCISGYRTKSDVLAEMVQECIEFDREYRSRIARTMSHNAIGQLRWKMQLAAQENFTLFRVGRFFKRFVSRPPVETSEFM